MARSISPFFGAAYQAFDDNGDPLSGGLLYVYLAGTTTPTPTYTGSTGPTTNSNPVQLDAAGRPPNEIWLTNGVNYKFTLRDADGALIDTWDNISGGLDSTGDFSALDSIADLRNATTTTVATDVVNVISYYSTTDRPDGGGGLFVYDPDDSSSTDNGGTIIVDASLRRWKRQYSGNVDVLWFGALGDGLAVNTTAFQNAIDWVYSRNGGTVFVSPGLYLVGALTLKYRVSLEGAEKPGLVESASTVPQTASTLKLVNATNAPMITTDKVNGPVRGSSPIGVGSQRYQNSGLRNLYLIGNRTNQTNFDADVIQAFQAWNFTVDCCSVIDAKGFGLRALDCNVLVVKDSSFVSAPWYFESLADSLLLGNHVGGGNGSVWPCMWMASCTLQAWQNIFSNNFIFNNSGNTASLSYTFTADAATDTITTSSAHGWSDGTPIVVFSTAGLPTNLSANETYYVKSTGATTLKLATTRANLAAGTYVDIASAGSGTLTIQMGYNAGVSFIGSLVKWNTFTANRIDQCYGESLSVLGAIENTFTANIINASGLGNATVQAAIDLDLDATDNVFTSNIVDGTTVLSGALSSNQVIGFRISDTSPGTVLSGNYVANNTTANLLVDGTVRQEEGFFLVPGDFEITTATPAIGLVGGGRRPVWLFDAAVNEGIGTQMYLPIGWKNIRVRLLWVNAGAGAGNVSWSATVGGYAVGESVNAADPFSAVTTLTAGAQDILTNCNFSGVFPVVDNDVTFLRILRDAATDTLPNDAGLIGVYVERMPD